MDSNCVKCKIVKKICRVPEGTGPKFCPTLGKKDIVEKSLEEYDRQEIKEFARLSSIQEGECYSNRDKKPYVIHPTKPRILEIMEFAQKMGYKKLGVAFCGGVTHEAGILVDILERNDFEVVAVSCKVGGVPKERIGLKDEEKINIGNHESMCNPIAQAMVLNDAKTDFNIMLCLCVGHDSLFLKYVEALTTVLAAKDRMTGHSPLIPLYTANSYYGRLRKLEFGSDEELKARLVTK
ncbi:MAG: DUF1847 domain-containing protein [Pseudomonadota bacterium]